MKNESLRLDFTADDELAGLSPAAARGPQLGHVRPAVWTLRTDGRNALLTGDIGSGKSTLVDALTTLLVPAQRVAYNKAAGADARERTLRSYVLGHYKSERNRRPARRRPWRCATSSYSVILGVFHNAGYDQTVTLAQVFWLQGPAGPARPVVRRADSELTIASDFADFGADIGELRKRLRAARAEVYDSFPPYGAPLRRRLGIQSEQALELFHQTVSMKSVGNLTDFVRNHMLEPSTSRRRDRRHDRAFRRPAPRARGGAEGPSAGRAARRRCVADCDAHDAALAAIEALRAQREALRPFSPASRPSLLRPDRSARATSWRGSRRSSRDARRRSSGATGQSANCAVRSPTTAATASASLERDIARGREKQRREARRRPSATTQLLRDAGLRPRSPTPAQFAAVPALQRRARRAREANSRRQNELNERRRRRAGARRRRRDERRTTELASLRARARSNIAAQQVDAARGAVRGPAARRDGLPFAGELIQVRDEERDWEGAAERVLRTSACRCWCPSALRRASANGSTRTPPRRPRSSTSASGPHERRSGAAAPRLHLVAGRQARDQAGLAVPRLAGARARAAVRPTCASSLDGQFRREPRADHARRPDQGQRRAPREGRPPPHRRPQPLRARLEQRAPRSPRCAAQSSTRLAERSQRSPRCRS